MKKKELTEAEKKDLQMKMEIAEELGISRSYISRIEKNALKKLRGEF